MAMRTVAIIGKGQSNKQGSACRWAGPRNFANIERARSLHTGESDPYPGCNNSSQGGSCFPFLQDLAWARGIRLRVFNMAIGGASVFQHTGRLGATITNPTVPASVGFFSGGEMSGGTTIQTEGDPEFDPFGLLARSRAVVQSLAGECDAIVSTWSNGESDHGNTAAQYRTGLLSVADYMLASGVDMHLIGLSVKIPTATDANMLLLQQGVAEAVAARSKCAAGADLYAYWGDNPPLYPETGGGPYVHLTLRGQWHHAKLWDAALAAVNYGLPA